MSVDRFQPQNLGASSAKLEEIGAKAFYLAWMHQTGVIRVPQGFVVPTAVGQEMAKQPGSYYESLPDGVWQGVQDQIKELERQTGKELGKTNHPLMIAARSGGSISMPGLMETILNIGSSRSLAESYTGSWQEWLMWDCYRTFCLSWVQAVTGLSMEELDNLFWQANENLFAQPIEIAKAQALFIESWFEHEYGLKIPQAPLVQLRTAIQAVLMSWDSPESMAYRRDQGHPLDRDHTGVTILEMVFGNRNRHGQVSGSGVVIMRPGQEPEITFAPESQGQKVVGDGADPKELAHSIPSENLVQLKEVLSILSQYFGGKVDAEFVIDLGKLILTQGRMLGLPPQEKIKDAYRLLQIWMTEHENELVDERQLKRFLWQSMTQAELELATGREFDQQALEEAQVILRGEGIAGVAVGQVVIFGLADQAARDMKRAVKLLLGGKSIVICSEYLEPNQLRTLLEKFPQGNAKSPRISFLTIYGSPSSHTALVAIKRQVAGVILGPAEAQIQSNRLYLKSSDCYLSEGDSISVNGHQGLVYPGELPIHEIEPTAEQKFYLKHRKEILGESLAVDAVMSGSFDEQYQQIQDNFTKLQQTDRPAWCSDKANSQEMLNHLYDAAQLEPNHFLAYQVLPRREVAQIIERIKLGLEQGYDVTVRCAFCHSAQSSSKLGKNPWVIFRPGQDGFVDDFFTGREESFKVDEGLVLARAVMADPGGDYQRETKISKYGLWPEWEQLAEDEDLVFEEVLIGYNPSGKLDANQAVNHFAATCRVINKGGRAVVQLLVNSHTPELRSFEGNSEYDSSNSIVVEVGINERYERGIGGMKLGLRVNHLDLAYKVPELVSTLKGYQPKARVQAIVNGTVECSQRDIGRYHRLVYHDICQLLGAGSLDQVKNDDIAVAIAELVEQGSVPKEILREVLKPESFKMIDQVTQEIFGNNWGKLASMLAILENEGAAVLELQGRIGGDWWLYGIKGLEERA